LKEGRLHSRVLGLHLERAGTQLRLWNPTSGDWLPTADEHDRAAEHTARLKDRQLAQALAEIERLRKLVSNNDS
jgi:hypothetical protein